MINIKQLKDKYFELLREFLEMRQERDYFKKQVEIYKSLYFGELNANIDKGLMK